MTPQAPVFAAEFCRRRRLRRFSAAALAVAAAAATVPALPTAQASPAAPDRALVARVDRITGSANLLGRLAAVVAQITAPASGGTFAERAAGQRPDPAGPDRRVARWPVHCSADWSPWRDCP